MKILVTGGAGFIGSAVCRYLIEQTDAEVINIDKLTYAGNLLSLKKLEQNPRYHFFQADILDELTIDSIFNQTQPDAVIHLAAESHVDRSITNSRCFIETNILGTFTLLEATRRFLNTQQEAIKERFRFLHVSTDEVYGTLDVDGCFLETTPYDPSSPYSASKAASDHLAIAWYRTYGVPTIVSNCSNNYGPFHFPEKLIPLTILNAFEKKPLPIYGKGLNVRDWLYVDDHASALHCILTRGKPGQKYNVGGRNERSNLEVVKTICGIFDHLRPHATPHEKLITFVEDRPGHDLRYAIDATKLESELGWKAKENFETGIRKTVSWYIENDWWWKPLREQIYSGNRIGLLK